MSRSRLTRRRFFQYVAVAASAAAASACASAGTPAPVDAPEAPPEAATVSAPASAETPVPTSKYQEAPMLAELVAKGELPPVDKRLPEEPLVIEPVEGIGQYGGVLRTTDIEPVTPCNVRDNWIQSMFTFSTDCTQVLPNLAKSYEWSDDSKVLTIHLRKGLKWSDGEPFTTDDIMFWYEDQLLNPELTPAIPRTWQPGDEVAQFEKVDDFTVRIRFAVPYPAAMSKLGHPTQLSQNAFYNPKHYLQKWHPKYNPDADALAKEEGYENWWEAYQFHANINPWEVDPNTPTMGTWVVKEVTPTHKTLVRNPYFWMVDTAGNQLPYVDEIVGELVSDIEVLNLKVISGETDYQGFDLHMENYPVYKESEEAGGYRVLRWKSIWGSAVSFMPNTNHKDPALRAAFEDVRFRQALSLAIDRDEINEKIFAGLGTPRQATVLPTCSFYKPEWGEAFAQYDPDEANRLLDEMGLTERDGDGYRLRPDGQTLAVVVLYIPVEGPKGPVCELVRDFWEEIGIKVTLKSTHRAYLQEVLEAGEHDIGVWHTDSCTEMFCQIEPLWFYPGAIWCMYVPEYRRWFTSGGEAGEEPPAEWKDFVDTFEKWNTTAKEQNEEEWISLAQKIWDFHAEHLYVIGTVGMPVQPITVKNYIGNVPEDGWWGWDNDFWATYRCAQWFVKQG